MGHVTDPLKANEAKSSKRKGTRSVLTLSRDQLERKRANDREAQRAIRARTKDYIERLEGELRDLKDTQREKLIDDLQARNKALQEEIWRLQRTHGVATSSSPYQSAVYDISLHSSAGSSGAIPSPRTSPFPTGPGDYAPLPDYNRGHFGQVTSNPDSWSSAPTSAVGNTMSSGVPSPTSSVPADEYYVPSGPVPPAMIPSHSNSSRGSSTHSRPTATIGGPRTQLRTDYYGNSDAGVKAEYDEPRSADGANNSNWNDFKRLMGDAEANFRLSSQPMPTGFMPASYTAPQQSYQQHPQAQSTATSPHHAQPMDMYPVYMGLQQPMGINSPM